MRKFIFPLISIFLLLFTSVSVVFAAEAPFADGSKFVTLGADEEIDKDYFAGGEEIQVSGTVNGDAYIGGGKIRIDGTVNGDLLIAGGDVYISGTVSQDIRVAGGQVIFSGKVGGNLTLVGGNIVVTDAAEVDGNLVIGAGNAEIAGTVAGDVTAGVGNLVISGKVGGDVTAGVDQLRLASKAAVGGDLSYFSDQEASIAKEATVSGEIARNEPSGAFRARDLGVSRKEAATFWTRAKQTTRVLSFLSTILVGLLLIHFYPKYSRQTANTLRKKPWASLGVGFIALILTPIAVIFIGITIIGIPIALILLATYLIYLYLAKIFVILWVGIIVSERANRKMTLGWTFVLGLITYSVFTLIPVIGGFTRLFALLFGLGAMLIACKEVYIAAKKKEVI